MTAADEHLDVKAEPDRDRFVVTVGGRPAGLAAYRDQAGTRIFTHTEVDPAFGGRGVGGELARVALDATRGAGLSVLPQCSFVAKFIDDHPAYRDLLAG